jgi:transcriptional regulator with XRE-family HTH domain
MSPEHFEVLVLEPGLLPLPDTLKAALRGALLDVVRRERKATEPRLQRQLRLAGVPREDPKPMKRANRRNKLDSTAFGRALMRLRDRTGLKQYEAADKAKISKGMASAYETGFILPSLPNLVAYLRAVDADFRDLQNELDGLEGARNPPIPDDSEDQERQVGRAVFILFDYFRKELQTEGDNDGQI